MFKDNRVFGAILIIVGTSIGASMLVLPMISSLMGMMNAFLLLFFIWLLGYLASTIILNVSLFYKGAFSVSELCKKSFSSKIWVLADLSIITLFYTLLSAYMSGIIDISVNNNITRHLDCISKNFIGCCIVVILIALIIFNFKVLDISNRIIVLVQLSIFVVILYFLSSKIELKNLRDCNILFGNNAYKAMPIFFTSFGFHGSIPFIIKYLDNNERNVRKACFFGSLMSLVIYWLWIFFTLSVLPKYGVISFNAVQHSNNKTSSFINMLAKVTSQHSLDHVVSLFSGLAIITSFLGVGIGLYDYFLEKLKLDNQFFINKLKAIVLTFLPPFVVAILNKNIFLSGLSVAAISLSLLAIILPSLILLKIGRKNKFTTVISLIIGLLIVIIEITNFLV